MFSGIKLFAFLFVVDQMSPTSAVMCYFCESLGTEDDCMNAKNMEEVNCSASDISDSMCTTILAYFNCKLKSCPKASNWSKICFRWKSGMVDNKARVLSP